MGTGERIKVPASQINSRDFFEHLCLCKDPVLGTVGGGEGRGRGRETVKMQDLIMSRLIGKCHPKQCGISAKSVLSELDDGEVGEGGGSQEELFQVGSTQMLVNKYEPFWVLAIQE